MTTERRIYVASLSDYNAGILHGRWIDVDGKDASDILDEVDAMLRESPTHKETGEIAEEWAIHDHEGFPQGSIGEWTSFARVCEIAELLEEHGDAFRAALDYFGGDVDEAKEAVEDRYRGCHANAESWAQEFLEDVGDLERVPEHLRGYIDFEAYARDQELGGDMMFLDAEEGGVHAFTTR